MLKEIENTEDVNKQLERIGYNMGVRLIEDFLARTGSGRCLEMRETADKIQQAFRYLYYPHSFILCMRKDLNTLKQACYLS